MLFSMVVLFIRDCNFAAICYQCLLNIYKCTADERMFNRYREGFGRFFFVYVRFHQIFFESRHIVWATIGNSFLRNFITKYNIFVFVLMVLFTKYHNTLIIANKRILNCFTISLYLFV